MALFMKQDFNPPLLSRKWISMKCRPNVLLYSRQHISSILESGLLFREDCIEVEQEAPSTEEVWKLAGGGDPGWLTRGEKILSVVTVAACVMAFPPKDTSRITLFRAAGYLAIPVLLRARHRALCQQRSLSALLEIMRDYLALSRRAAACVKENKTLQTQLGSVASVIESTYTMLCRQQSELSITMLRASSALLGNAPWLHGDLAWQLESQDDDNLLKIHHAFLVVQSALLKHIALAHYIPPGIAQKLYKNHNERIYWLHTVLIEHLNQEFRENFEALERMYRLLKNYGNKDLSIAKKPGFALTDSWLCSEVHNGVARASLELRMALNKCTKLDMFLDSCAINKHELDLDLLNKDIDVLIEDITKCLSTAQSSQIRLKKLQIKFGKKDQEDKIKDVAVEEVDENTNVILRIEDREPETKDEVFYCFKTEEDDVVAEVASDLTTAPGKKEKEITNMVLNELSRKLVKIEDAMRERERQALVNTMPELRNKVPEFPRQNFVDVAETKGFTSKISRKIRKKRLFKNYKIQHRKNKQAMKLFKNYKIKHRRNILGTKLKVPHKLVANKLDAMKDLLTSVKIGNLNYVLLKTKKIIWYESYYDSESSELSDCVSDVADSSFKKTVNDAINNIKFEQPGDDILKKNWEISSSNYEEMYNHIAILTDMRRYRASLKNYPNTRYTLPMDSEVDESMKPIEYSFGTGMAMASVLQKNCRAKLPNMAQEEVFVGEGEVSEDSGNDEDA